MTAPSVQRRADRVTLLERMPKGAVCAEIGVWKGEFSQQIFELTSPRTFHLIDPWAFQAEFPGRYYGGLQAKNQGDMDDIFESVKRIFSGQSSVVFNRGKSAEVLPTFDDDYFDWIYVDGNHSYENVLEDMNLGLPKVKSGGYITGDDYTWGENEGFPVKKAVQEFVDAHDLRENLDELGSQFIIRV